MGLIKNGILDGFSGKVGTVVGGSWRGKNVMRAKPTKRKNANRTDKQIDHRAKFTVATQFLQSMKDLLELTYRNYAVGKTGANSALGHTLRNAITGEYPDYRIAYDKAMISRGSLLPALGGKATAGAAGIIQFTWDNTADILNARKDDQVLMVLHYPELNITMYKIGAPRSAGSDSFTVPGLSGKVVQTWISFLTADAKDVSSSVYSGEVGVT